MDTVKSDIGVLGLGVMGAMLALNFADNGFNVALFNRTASKAQQPLGTTPKTRTVSTARDDKRKSIVHENRYSLLSNIMVCGIAFAPVHPHV